MGTGGEGRGGAMGLGGEGRGGVGLAVCFRPPYTITTAVHAVYQYHACMCTYFMSVCRAEVCTYLVVTYVDIP